MQFKSLWRTTRSTLGVPAWPSWSSALSQTPCCSTHCIIRALGEKKIDQMAAQTQIGSHPQDAERPPICSESTVVPSMLRELAAAGPLLQVKKGTIYYKGPSLNQSANSLWWSGSRSGLWALSSPRYCYLCVTATFCQCITGLKDDARYLLIFLGAILENQ